MQGRSNNSRTLPFLGHLHVVLVFVAEKWIFRIRKCLLINIYKYLQDIQDIIGEMILSSPNIFSTELNNYSQ